MGALVWIGLEGQGPSLAIHVRMNFQSSFKCCPGADVAAANHDDSPRGSHLRKVSRGPDAEVPEVQLLPDNFPRSFAFNTRAMCIC